MTAIESRWWGFGVPGRFFFSAPRDDKMLWVPVLYLSGAQVSFQPKQTHSVLENYFRLPGDFGHVLSAIPSEQTKMLEKILTQHRLASS